MPQRAATVVGLPMAFALLEAVHSVGSERGERYRSIRRRTAHVCVPVSAVPLRLFAFTSISSLPSGAL